MRILNLLLTALVVFLGYMLVKTIYEPIEFNREFKKRDVAVQDKLTYIRDLQLAYKDVHGKFSASFDSLKLFVENDSIKVLKVIGDPDEIDAQVTYITNKIAVKDTLVNPVYKTERLEVIPGVDEQFTMEAGTVERGRLKVPVFEVTATFPQMLKGLNKRYIDPTKVRKIGSLIEPNYNGNWESR